MISLTEEDREVIRHLDSPEIVNLSIGSYLVKKASIKYYNELIGVKLAELFGLKCPKYYVYELDNEKYVLSEDLNKYGKFRTANTFLTELIKGTIVDLYEHNTTDNIKYSNNIYDIWAYFAANYDDETVKKLMKDIIKVYIFDILFSNFDRRIDNWGLITYPNNSVDITIFDNEHILRDDDLIDMNVDFQSDYSANIDLKKFLKESSQEFVDLFKYYFDLVTPELLKKLIEEVEEEKKISIDYKDELIKNYSKNRNVILNTYNEEIRKEDPHAR